MNISDIVALAKAGFTAEQIAGLSTVKEQAPTPAPAPAPAQPEQANTIADILNSIRELNTSIQANAIRQSEQPKPQTPEEILANIINPPIKKGE